MDSDFKFVPMANLSESEREERVARARQSLRKSWDAFEASGQPMPTDEEIDAEIAAWRRETDEGL